MARMRLALPPTDLADGLFWTSKEATNPRQETPRIQNQRAEKVQQHIQAGGKKEHYPKPDKRPRQNRSYAV
jgi:hypothetical protein